MKTTLTPEHLMQWAAEVREERDAFEAEAAARNPGHPYVAKALELYNERIRILEALAEEALAQ